MRVALVVTGGVDRSGRERVVPALVWLIERLARQHELVVYALRYHSLPCRYPLVGATVQDLGSPRGIVRQHAALVRAMRRDGPFDLAHAYWALPAGLAAGAAARRLGIPCVLTLDSGELVSLPDIHYGLQRTLRQRTAARLAFALATRITVCTQYMATLAAGHGLAPEVLPLGVDTTLFKPAPHAAAPPWRLLHVASLNPVKDQITLLYAFRRALAEMPACRLDIVGEDTMDGRLQQHASELDLTSAITFHGVLPSEQLVPLYQRAHLFVLSSRHEAANVAALEAAACGIPTVGPRVGYLADWALGPTVPAGDPDALGRAIVHMLRDRAAAAHVAAVSRAWALTHDADWTAREFDRLYRELSPSASASPSATRSTPLRGPTP